VNAGGIFASVLLHVALFAVVTRTNVPPPPKEKTAIRVLETKPKPEEQPAEPDPVETPPEPEATKPQPAPPKPEPAQPKPQAEPAPEPADTPQPSNAPPLDLGNMTFTNDSGGGPAVSSESLGRDPNDPKQQPKPQAKPRPDDKTDGDKPKPKADVGACAEELVKPKPLAKVPIEYPAAAREQGIEGQLVLRAKIGPDGTVTEVEVLKSAGALIDEPAVAALKSWTFEPATKCGKATESTFTISRRFEIGT
jgi:periplasmic protein TonB